MVGYMTEYARFSWTVLLPVKVLARAKSRLAVLAGDRRHELALALASDTVSAVVACPEVARVIVITSDPVAGPRLAALGAHIIGEAAGDPNVAPGGERRRQPARAQRGAAARRGGGGATVARDRPGGADRGPARAAPGRTCHGAARGRSRDPGRGARAGPGVRAGRRRGRHHAVRGAAGRAVPADVRRGVPGAARRRRPPSSRSTASPDCARTWTRLTTCARRWPWGSGPRTAEVAAELLADV